MDFKSLIEDEVYDSLRSTFLASGRGRRPDLLQGIVVNKKLLVQLHYLKEESSKSWKEINECLIKLSPGIAQHEKRFRHAIETSFREFVSNPNDAGLLRQGVDFDFISPVLSQYGITRASMPYPPSTSPKVSLTNEVAVQIELARRDMGLPPHLTAEWLGRLGNVPSSTKLDHLIKKTYKQYELLRSKKGKYPDQYHTFLKAAFNPPTDLPILSERITIEKNIQTVSNSKGQDDNLLLKEKCERISTLEAALADVTRDKFLSQQEVQSLKEKLRDYEGSEERHLKDCNLKLNKEQEKRKVDLKEFQKTIKSLKLAHDKACKAYDDEISKLQLKLKKQISKTYETKLKCRYLSSELNQYIVKVEDLSNNPLEINLKTGRNNEYSDDVRKTVISLICEAGVSAKNVRNVINIVAKNIFHHTFCQNLPCAQTALNMCDEGFVISNIQVAENILSCDNVTLHSDGTSRDQKKIVGHQFSLGSSGETFYLGFLPVATEDAQTLLDITMIVIEKMNECYSDLSPHSPEHTLKEIFSKISSVMSDRAACMKLFGKKFESRLQSEIGESFQMNFLHCNAHFLLGVSSCFEKALSSFERKLIWKRGEYLGRDKSDVFSSFSKESESATNRMIRTICNLLGPRGDQKSGCRPEWVTFCSDSKIPSFKSNRFNCFFQAAAAILHHHAKLLTFFTSGILHENPNLLIRSVTLDIQDPVLLTFVCSVALFYLKVTLPYWSLVKSDVKYTEFYKYVQKMFNYFEKWSEDPVELLDPSFKCIFDDFSKCSDTVIFNNVHSHIEKLDVDLVKDICKSLSQEVTSVTQRQLADFLNDGTFDCPDDEVKEKLKHCSLTNLVGESAFGDFDYDMGKRRNATLHNRSAVHSIKRNKTMAYLGKKSAQEQKHIFKIARKHGAKMRKDSSMLEEKVKNEIRTKFVNNQQKQIDKTLKGMQQRTKIEKDVADHGGPCQNAIDVDNLHERLTEEGCSKKKIMDIFKNEIRYHKLISKSKLLKFGDINFMINAIKQYLDCTLEDENPQSSKRRKM